ncbi:ABC transporter ATP-binding protein [uncultured Roseobacter sp.]|uniref:ABC transporter ATP-binding protein n=1 Tax=uncultured Roseobacter sp. TaxID=114847 RepID=UPI00260A350F|nr:ABC transporter ATP-binding protein [uncultured Roseobacter sp.]
MTAIQINDLSKAFGDFIALQELSLSVSEGEFLTLLGPSGCGKTTLLKMISGFIEPTSGSIEIDGTDVTSVPPEHRNTAMCFQSYALFPHLSVRENLEFGLKEQRVARNERKSRVQEVADQLELGQQLSKLPNELSGGQQQRVALGRALVMRPKVILFDEPLSNLDAKLRDNVRLEIRRIQKSFGLTAIYVTHDQSEALAMSDRILVMNAGRAEQLGTPEEIYVTPKTSFVADFIGSANVMSGKVVGEVSNNIWAVDTDLGQFHVASDDGPAGPDVNICWRPERGTILSGDEEPGQYQNLILSKVNVRSYQGGHTDLFFEEKGVSFRTIGRDLLVDIGDECRICIDPKDVVFLEVSS